MHTAIIIQFSKSFIDPFLKVKEFGAASSLLVRAEKGLFFPDVNTKACNLIKELTQSNGVYTLTGLLQLLDILS